jgi:hypothetical protein
MPRKRPRLTPQEIAHLAVLRYFGELLSKRPKGKRGRK